MSVRYHRRDQCLVPDYLCLNAFHRGRGVCQVIAGAAIDEAVGQLLVTSTTMRRRPQERRVHDLLGVLDGDNAGSRKLPRQFWLGLALTNIVDVSGRRRAAMVVDFRGAGWAASPSPFWRTAGDLS